MVSSKLAMKRLKALFNAFQRLPFPSGMFRDGIVGDAAFEISTAGTFVAGVASSILDGKTVGVAERRVLERVFLADTRWILEDGRQIDLRNYPTYWLRHKG
jgi:hypothetical protein